MEPAEFVESVRTEKQTALSRLGSSKALYAATGGEMEPEAVLRATAGGERAARDTFREWARTAEESPVAEFFETVAGEEDDHYRTVRSQLGEETVEENDELPALHEYLRGLSGSVARLGAFVGRTVASDASKGQVIGFFVGKADPRTAETFRTLRADLDGQLDGALSRLAEVCETDEDWAVAHEHAEAAIQTVYEEHVASLESMGIDPKPVC